MSGFIAFVGAGPGRPELITLRGLQLLQRADVVVTDDLVHPEIYLRHPRPEAEIIRSGKRGGRPSATQDEVNAVTLDHARQGKFVVRLKGGDTMIFGRLREEMDAAQAAGIPYEIVPGVTAASGCSAYAGPLLTERQRGRAVTLLTGTTADGEVDWQAATRLGLLVMYMGVTGISQHVTEMRAVGLPDSTPVAIVRWGSRGFQSQWLSNLGEVASLVESENIRPPALVLVGNQQHKLEAHTWWTSKPLFGTTLMMFRPDARGWLLADRLREQGCEVLNMPTRRGQRIAPTEASDPEALQVFTSAQAVHHAPAIAQGATVLAVGPSTAEALRERGLPCHVVGSGQSQSLAQYLQASAFRLVQHWSGEHLRPELADICRSLPLTYRAITVYRMQDWAMSQDLARETIERLPDGSILYATSPKTFAPVADTVRAQGDRLRLWAIGHTTAQELIRDGFAVTRTLGASGLTDHDAQLEHALREHAGYA